MLVITRRFGVAGAPETLQLKKEDANGGYSDLTGKYTGEEALTCVLWPGDDRAVTATLPAVWGDVGMTAEEAADAGRAQIEFPLDVMTTLEVTWHSGMLKLADGSADLAAFRLEVTAGPGAATAPKTYHTYKDLTNELPFVAKLASYFEDQSGFIEVAAEARRWIDAAILRSVPTPGWSRFGFTSSRSYGPWNGGNGNYGSIAQGENPVIAAALDADQLVITTATGRRFVEASVYYTLSKVLRRAVGMQTDNDLIAMSKDYDRQAHDKLMTCVAEIDVDGDGWPEYVFPLDRIIVRRA